MTTKDGHCVIALTCLKENVTIETKHFFLFYISVTVWYHNLHTLLTVCGYRYRQRYQSRFVEESISRKIKTLLMMIVSTSSQLLELYYGRLTDF